MKLRETIKQAASRLGSFIASQWRAKPWRLLFCALLAVVLLALLVGCGSRPERPGLERPALPSVPVEPGGSFDDLDATETELRTAYQAARAEAEGLRQQANELRSRLAREGFQNTAKWFNYAGVVLCLLSAGLALASFVVPPTIVPRKLAFGSLAIGLGMLAGSYLLVMYGVQASWAIGALFALLIIHSGFALWPVYVGDLRRKLEAKGRRLIASEDDNEGKRIADRITGRAIAEVANPQAKRKGVYVGAAPVIQSVRPVEGDDAA